MILLNSEHIAEFKARGWWSDQTIDERLRNHVTTRGDGEALVDPPNLPELADLEPRRLTWRQVDAEVERRAALFYALGLRKDDIVLVQMVNGVELTLTYLACFRLGLIASPAPAQYRLGELTGIVRRVSAVAAIASGRIGKYDAAATMMTLKSECPSIRHVLIDGAAPQGAIAITPALADLTPAQFNALGEALHLDPPSADDVATICWTSGTEAEPKGVPRNHNEWVVQGQGVIGSARLATGVRLLNPFPMVNMAGLATGMFTWLESGGTLVLHHPFELPVFLRQIRDEAIEYTVAPPAIMNLLLNNPDLVAGVDFTRLRKIGSGSAPLSEWMVRTFQERYGVEVLNIFGSNEGASFAASSEDIPDPADRAVCFPRLGDHGFEWAYPMADRVKTRLVDPDTEEEVTEPGRPAELRVKGPTIFGGYWQAPDITARAFDADGWFRTGDLFEITGPQGRYYRFCGRHKDIVIRGGMNISAEEIENHLLGHPGVTDAAVIGAPDKDLGERLCACVVLRSPDVTMEDLNHYLIEQRRVAVFKQIERLVVMPELPRNPVGKVLKRDLRASLFQ